jgi:hypothetical protein
MRLRSFRCGRIRRNEGAAAVVRLFQVLRRNPDPGLRLVMANLDFYAFGDDLGACCGSLCRD